MLAFTEWGNSRQPGRGSPPFHTHGAPAGRRPCPLWPERQQLSRRERSRCAGAGGRACQTLGSPPPPCQQAVQSHQCQSCQLKKKKLSIVDLQCCVNFYGASLVAQRLKRLPASAWNAGDPGSISKVIQLYIYTLLFHIPFHHGLSQDFE